MLVVDAKGSAQSFVFEVAFGELPHRSIATQSNQIRHLFEHEPKFVKGYVGQLTKADVEYFFRMGE